MSKIEEDVVLAEEECPTLTVITHDRLQLEEIVESVATSKAGATSTFIGTTRDFFDGQRVVLLEYEAYESMAIKKLKEIISRCRKAHPVLGVAIHHRLGVVPVKEASVIIAVSSIHRAEGLDAVRFLIDELKKDVPIFKKEVYDDSSSTWKQNADASAPTPGADSEVPPEAAASAPDAPATA